MNTIEQQRTAWLLHEREQLHEKCTRVRVHLESLLAHEVSLAHMSRLSRHVCDCSTYGWDYGLAMCLFHGRTTSHEHHTPPFLLPLCLNTGAAPQVQNRTRHAFGVRMLKNQLVCAGAGQLSRHPSPAAAIYGMELGTDEADATVAQLASCLPPRPRTAQPMPFRVSKRMAWEEQFRLMPSVAAVCSLLLVSSGYPVAEAVARLNCPIA